MGMSRCLCLADRTPELVTFLVAHGDWNLMDQIERPLMPAHAALGRRALFRGYSECGEIRDYGSSTT